MYDSRLNLYSGLFSDPMDNIGSNYQQQPSTQAPSVAAVLAKQQVQQQQQQNQAKPSNLPSVGSAKSNASYTPQQNNPSIGALGSTGNWVSGITSGINSFLATKNQKDAEDKQLVGQIIEGLGKGMGGMAMSDKRLKENIRPVGKLDNGLTVYAFNYKGQDVTQIGLIAQEVAEVIPEAVKEGEDGFLRVNYDLATRSK